MKTQFLLIITTLFFTLNVKAQCNSSKNKVLILGDSWAAFSWQYNSHNINFDKYGFTDYKAYSTGASISPTGGTPDLSQSGSQARGYLTSLKKSVIQTTFSNNPDINIAHLSTGGNDFLNSWDTTWTQAQINTLTLEVFDSITSIINFLKLQKPDIKILLSGYDYPNFEEVVNGNSNHPYYARWAAMSKPRFIQVNTLLANLNTYFKNYALAGTNLYFVDNIGLMQYIYGQTTPLLFPPGGTYSPASIPFPGGNPNYPSPLGAMNMYFFVRDAFHLSSAGFTHLAENQVKNFYFKAFRNYDITTICEYLKNGYVNSTGAFADTSIIIGNINNVKHVGVVSFTIPLLDATKSVEKVTLFIKRKNLIGSNPLPSSPITVEMKAGDIGTSPFLDNMDYTTVINDTITNCQYGSLNGNDYWMRIELPQFIYQQILSNQRYQFRLSIAGNGSNANQSLEFYADNNLANAPFLDIKYNTPNFVNEFNGTQLEQLNAYPNPVGDKLYINLKNNYSINTLEVLNSLGQKIQIYYTVNKDNILELDTQNLTETVYFLKLNNQVTKIIKLK